MLDKKKITLKLGKHHPRMFELQKNYRTFTCVYILNILHNDAIFSRFIIK